MKTNRINKQTSPADRDDQGATLNRNITVKNKINPASKGTGSHGTCVRLQLIHPTAQEVCIAASFNDWNPSVTPMIWLGEGKWVKELALSPGRYEYRFVVDGVWMDDPRATQLIPNSFGTANAVLVVEPGQGSNLVRSGSSTSPTRQTGGNATPSAQRKSCCA